MKISTSINYLSIIGLFLLAIVACEEGFEPPTLPGNRPDVVVEAYVEAYAGGLSPDEAGIVARPAYVIITNSVPFGESFNAITFDEIFVHDATVTLSSNNLSQDIKLQEFCLNNLGEAERALIVAATGVNSEDFTQLGIDFNETDFCFYSDLNPRSFEVGDTFNLTIEVDDKIFTATTTTPPLTPINDIQFRLPPGDSSFFSQGRLRQMAIKASPPDSIDTFFRYFTQRNDEPMYRGNAAISGFRSVLQGRVFGNGEEFI
ncbi:MAG: DUF4249 family protein, partial [Bacteroidota bacterium]